MKIAVDDIRRMTIFFYLIKGKGSNFGFGLSEIEEVDKLECFSNFV